jgi:hypothetical protein
MIYHSEMARKHSIPAFLEGMVDSDAYVRWLGRKGQRMSSVTETAGIPL